MISTSLWQIPLGPVSSWLPEPAVRDKGWEKPHFIFISSCHREVSEDVQTPFIGEATSPSLLRSSTDKKGVLCLLQKKKKRSQQKVWKWQGDRHGKNTSTGISTAVLPLDPIHQSYILQDNLLKEYVLLEVFSITSVS